MHAIMFAVALLHVAPYGRPTVKPSNTVTVAPVVITATWTCSAPRSLMSDATATVKNCYYAVH